MSEFLKKLNYKLCMCILFCEFFFWDVYISFWGFFVIFKEFYKFFL